MVNAKILTTPDGYVSWKYIFFKNYMNLHIWKLLSADHDECYIDHDIWSVHILLVPVENLDSIITKHHRCRESLPVKVNYMMNYKNPSTQYRPISWSWRPLINWYGLPQPITFKSEPTH